MLKWDIFNASVLVIEHGHPPFSFQNWSSHMINHSVDKVWTKIYCHFYFRGITLRTFSGWSMHKSPDTYKNNLSLNLQYTCSFNFMLVFIVSLSLLSLLNVWLGCEYAITVESRFFEPPGETQIGSRNRRCIKLLLTGPVLFGYE